MKNIYYDAYKSTSAFNLRNTNIKLAIERYEEYLEEYPLDYTAMIQYASVLISDNQLEKAEKILDRVFNNISNDKKYNADPSKKEKGYAEYLYVKIRLLVYSDRYEECHKLIRDNFKRIVDNKVNVGGVILLCEKELDLPITYEVNEEKYLYSQIVDYSKDRFLEHTKSHLEFDEEEEKQSLFSEEFKFDEVLEEVEKKLATSPRLYLGLIEDTCLYKYDFCGSNNYKKADYFKVILLHGTNNIITMHPYVYGKYLPYIDLNYLKDKPKVKTISQIDKFNMKYGKKLD